MEYLLVGIALVLATLCGLALTVSTRRGSRVAALEGELHRARQSLSEAEGRIEDKTQVAEEALGKLGKVRDEAQKAKKKAYLLEQQDKDLKAEPEAKAVRAVESELEEARSKIRQVREEAQAAAEECERLRGQLEKAKAELTAAKSELTSVRSAKQSGAAPAPVPADKQSADLAALRDRCQRFGAECDDLNKKLEVSKRKARSDSQVYKVTNSKLELALEKIEYLHKLLMVKAGAAPSRPPQPPAESVPPAETDIVPAAITADQTDPTPAPTA